MENLPDILMDWKVIILAVFALAEAIVRITPSEKDNSIVNKVVTVATSVLDFLLPNKSRSGGLFKLFSGLRNKEEDGK